MAVVENVYFYYGKIVRPGLKYETEDEYEYEVDVLLPDEDTADFFKENFPKQKVKEFNKAKFEETFKVEPPFSAKKYYMFKIKKPAQKADGSPLPEIYVPKIFVKEGKGLVPIKKEFANGAKGALEYETYSNKFGTFAKLKNIRLDDWEEYTREEETELGVVTHGSELGQQEETMEEDY